MLADDGLKHVHLLVTGQIEPAPKLIRSFIEAGLPAALHANDVDLICRRRTKFRDLSRRSSELQWASLRPELRPLLTNLKILDWLVAAARSGKAINPASIIGVSHLVDALWERWIEGDTDQLSRSHLLMRLGTLEGDTLLASVPRMQLETKRAGCAGEPDCVGSCPHPRPARAIHARYAWRLGPSECTDRRTRPFRAIRSRPSQASTLASRHATLWAEASRTGRRRPRTLATSGRGSGRWYRGRRNHPRSAR